MYNYVPDASNPGAEEGERAFSPSSMPRFEANAMHNYDSVSIS